jgi:hypothetical protein
MFSNNIYLLVYLYCPGEQSIAINTWTRYKYMDYRIICQYMLGNRASVAKK